MNRTNASAFFTWVTHRASGRAATASRWSMCPNGLNKHTLNLFLKRKNNSLSALCVLLAMASGAQQNITTLGIQFKPMVPNRFLGVASETATNSSLTVEFTPAFGYNLGMVIRRGLTKNWSLETGINLVQRNYRLRFFYPELSAPQPMQFRLIGYELPVQGMIYVRLGDKLWMNASGGFSVDLYPSNVHSYSTLRVDSNIYDFYQKTYRTNWMQFALLANYGFEYRTKESGYFYMGVSFHRPFADIGISEATLEDNRVPVLLQYGLNGSYLTADLRYFFHEKPEHKKKKTNSGPG
ncbi:MAG: outer membrane beta-barrel protein [Flavobacteriales bacterium]